MSKTWTDKLIPTGEATAILPVDEGRIKPVTVIGTPVPSGAGRGQRSVPRSRPVSEALGRRVAVEGASKAVLESLGIPARWADRCENAAHVGHDDTRDALSARLDWHLHSGDTFR